jgi:hypothetical protein
MDIDTKSKITMAGPSHNPFSRLILNVDWVIRFMAELSRGGAKVHISFFHVGKTSCCPGKNNPVYSPPLPNAQPHHLPKTLSP